MKLSDVFRGLETAHGVYRPTGRTTSKGKTEGKHSIVHEPPTEALWDLHFAGKQGLGIFPLTGAKCLFAAIDVDQYPLDHERMEARIRELGLPLNMCRSKSGGAHLYLFGSEELSAKLVRQKFLEWLVPLGIHKHDLYPKADKVIGDSMDGFINMPYFNEANGMQFGIRDGKPQTKEDFLGNLVFTTPRGLKAIQVTAETDELTEAPPCLVALTQAPIIDHRNDCLINLGVYAKMRHGEEWEDALEGYNQQFMEPALKSGEVQAVLKSLKKKDYVYTCGREPIMGLCNKVVCYTRKWGVRGDQARKIHDVINIGQLIKFNTDPPSWELEVEGQTIVVRKTKDLLSFAKMRELVMDKVNTLLPVIKQTDWDNLLRTRIETVEVVEAPLESDDPGRVLFEFEKWCVHSQARVREEMKDGKVWWENGHVEFRMPVLHKYLQAQKLYPSNKELALMFRKWGAGHGTSNFKGKCVQFWTMPAPSVQTEENE